MIKSVIRNKMLLERRNMEKEDKMRMDDRIIQHIIKDPNFIKARTIAIYYPMADEINVLPLLKTNKVFCMPKIHNKQIDFYLVDENTCYQKHKFGILEPLGENIVDVIDYMIVPMLAFNEAKDRIGFGQGYYDRYLQRTSIDHVVGIAYDFQKRDFNRNDHDQKMHYIITNKGVI